MLPSRLPRPEPVFVFGLRLLTTNRSALSFLQRLFLILLLELKHPRYVISPPEADLEGDLCLTTHPLLFLGTQQSSTFVLGPSLGKPLLLLCLAGLLLYFSLILLGQFLVDISSNFP